MTFYQYIELTKNSTLIPESFIKNIRELFWDFHMSDSLEMMLEV